MLVAPTSTSARPTSFRPTIELLGRPTQVLVEQTMVMDEQRLGTWVGRLTLEEQREVEDALRLALALD